MANIKCCDTCGSIIWNDMCTNRNCKSNKISDKDKELIAKALELDENDGYSEIFICSRNGNGCTHIVKGDKDGDETVN